MCHSQFRPWATTPLEYLHTEKQIILVQEAEPDIYFIMVRTLLRVAFNSAGNRQSEGCAVHKFSFGPSFGTQGQP